MRRTAFAVMAGCFAAAALAAPTPLGDVVRVSPDDGFNHSTAQIARTPTGGFIATWYASSDPSHDVDVLAQVFGPDGAPASSLIEVNQTRAGIQIISSVDVDAAGNFTVTWVSSDGEPSWGNRAIYARRFLASGAPRDGEFRVDTRGLRYLYDPSVSMAPDGRFVIAWKGDASVWARLFDAAGHPRGPELEVQMVFGDSHPYVVMRDDGSFIVAYSDNSAGPQSVAMRGFDADGHALFGRVQANFDEQDVFHSTPSVGVDGAGGIYVVWNRSIGTRQDTFLRRFDAHGAPLGNPQQVNPADQPAYLFPSVGVDASGAALVAYPDADLTTLYAQAFDVSGNPDGARFVVNAPDPGHSFGGYSSRAIAYDGQGGFVIAWWRYTGASAVYAQFYGGRGPGEDPPGDEDPGCDHDEESDEDHDNGCGNDPGEHDDDPGCDHDEESNEDHDNGCGNDPDDGDEGDDGDGAAVAAPARADGDRRTGAGSLNFGMLLLLAGATALRRRPKGAGRTSGSPARC